MSAAPVWLWTTKGLLEQLVFSLPEVGSNASEGMPQEVDMKLTSESVGKQAEGKRFRCVDREKQRQTGSGVAFETSKAHP